MLNHPHQIRDPLGRLRVPFWDHVRLGVLCVYHRNLGIVRRRVRVRLSLKVWVRSSSRVRVGVRGGRSLHVRIRVSARCFIVTGGHQWVLYVKVRVQVKVRVRL